MRFTQGIHAVDTNAPEVLYKRWSLTESRLRDALLSDPLKRYLTPIQIAEAFQLKNFITGMRYRARTGDWLEATWKEAKKEAKRKTGTP